MIKAVLFDLDNTLSNYDKANEVAMHALYEEFKKDFDISFEKFKEVYAESKDEIKRELLGQASSHNRILYMQRLVEKTYKTILADRILQLYHAYWDTFVENDSLLPNAIHMLDYINQRGLKMAVVTNLTAYVQFRRINKLGITKYIDHLVTSEEAGMEKPHPAVFLLALNKMKIKPEEALMVGDSVGTDIEGGNFVGMKTVRVRFGEGMKSHYESSGDVPTFAVNDLSEIITILGGLA